MIGSSVWSKDRFQRLILQENFSLVPKTGLNIGKCLSFERVGRYLPDAGGDFQRAFRLYIYNIKLCEAFYAPMNMTEIVFRNAISTGLTNKYGADGHIKSGALYRNLNKVGKRSIDKATLDSMKGHGVVTLDHIITSLPLGFWVEMLKTWGPNMLRQQDINLAFPSLPNTLTKKDMHKKAKSFQKFRNKIFHHNAIFDRKPIKEYHNMRDIVGWTCKDSLWLMGQISNPVEIVNRKPTF